MTGTSDALGDFAAALQALLLAAASNHPAAADIRASAAMLADGEYVVAKARRGDAELPRLPVCRFWDAALAAAGPEVAALRDALQRLAPDLAWVQNPNYRSRPPVPDFLANYGYAVIVGPGDGPPAPARDPRLALGVLLLGPGTEYPAHHHPAVEHYLPLTAADWWRADDGWRQQPAGALIHHASNLAHAMRAGRDPLLALYLWRGDLATYARIDAAE
jgi:dimethlysulfoniopropionate lyase